MRVRLLVSVGLLAVVLVACGADSEGKTDGPVDADGDGFFEDEDCNDADAEVYPGAPELCDGKDNDCDDLTDIDDTDVVGVDSAHVDSDLDGYGDPLLISYFCEGAPPDNVVDNADDCDDRDDSVNPLGNEVCDGKDNDCDGLTDGDDTDADAVPTWAPDADGDGYGDGDAAFKSCENPGDGFAENDRDCNDSNATINPDAAETCGDGIDSDCDGADGPDRFEGDSFLTCGYAGYGSAGTELAHGDIDGDGDSELLLTDGALDAALDILSADLTELVPATGDGVGGVVAVGDLDEDGVDDVIYAPEEAADAGVWLGPISGALGASDGTAGASGDTVVSLLLAHDLGGDGQPDLLMGTSAGTVLHWDAPLSGGAGTELELGGAAGDAISWVGDVDGDGLVDVAVGAPDASELRLISGGISGGLPDDVLVFSGDAGSGFGASAAGWFDLDGDGTEDLVVGAPDYDGSRGAVYVFIGVSGDAAAEDAWLRIDGFASDFQLGRSLDVLRDINDDDAPDLVVGAPGRGSSSGSVEVILGPLPGGVETTNEDVSYHLEGGGGDRAGSSVIGLPDVDGDGRSDWAGAAAGSGKTWLFLGGRVSGT